MAVSSVVTHVGVVLAEVVLVFFSVLSFAIMIERALSLRRKTALEKQDYPPLKEALRSRQADRITARIGASRAPSAAALAAGFSHQDASPERVREVVEQEILLQNAALQHRLRTLATIAATAPYIGLFGTVLGILAAFHKIAVEGQMGASAVAGGITEALVTTALGLGVAVPAVMGYNWLSGLVNDLSLTVETHARDLAAFLPELQTAGIGGNRYEGR